LQVSRRTERQQHPKKELSFGGRQASLAYKNQMAEYKNRVCEAAQLSIFSNDTYLEPSQSDERQGQSYNIEPFLLNEVGVRIEITDPSKLLKNIQVSTPTTSTADSLYFLKKLLKNSILLPLLNWFRTPAELVLFSNRHKQCSIPWIPSRTVLKS